MSDVNSFSGHACSQDILAENWAIVIIACPCIHEQNQVFWFDIFLGMELNHQAFHWDVKLSVLGTLAGSNSCDSIGWSGPWRPRWLVQTHCLCHTLHRLPFQAVDVCNTHKQSILAFFSLRCSARERFWLETASQTWKTKSFNRFQGPLTVERTTTGQVRILKEGFQYKAIWFFWVRFKESEGLEQANSNRASWQWLGFATSAVRSSSSRFWPDYSVPRARVIRRLARFE